MHAMSSFAGIPMNSAVNAPRPCRPPRRGEVDGGRPFLAPAYTYRMYEYSGT